MKTFASISAIVAPMLFMPRVADACGPCGSGVDCQHIADICRQDLWSAEVSCIESACAAPCASWLAAVDSGTCTSLPYEQACMSCMTTPEPMGCGQELAVCGADRTGGITCASWLTAGGDGADLLPYDSLDAGIDLSGCVCDGACGLTAAGPCASACAGDYLHPSAMTNGCNNCVKKTCGPQRTTCLSL